MNKENMKAFVTVKIPVQWIKSLSYQRGKVGGAYIPTQTGTVRCRAACFVLIDNASRGLRNVK